MVKKQVEKKLVGTEEVLSAIGELAGAVGSGFEKVNDNLIEVKQEVKVLNKKVEGLQYQFDRLETYVIKDHERRLVVLEHGTGTKK